MNEAGEIYSMAQKLSRSLILKTVVAIFSAALAVLGMAVVVPAALGQDEATTETQETPDAPENDEPSEPANEDLPQTMAAQAPAGFKISYDIDVVSKLANPNLDGDLSIGTGRFDGIITDNPDAPDGGGRIEGDLDLPPADGYFVAFRFVPVTNTTTLIPAGKATGTADLSDIINMKAHIDLRLKLYIKLTDAKQDGVPLHVGAKCRTKTPASIRIKGTVSLAKGVPSDIESSYDIPRFSGCGTREDLDPLLSGLVSAKKNHLVTTMTSRCEGVCLEP